MASRLHYSAVGAMDNIVSPDPTGPTTIEDVKTEDVLVNRSGTQEHERPSDYYDRRMQREARNVETTIDGSKWSYGGTSARVHPGPMMPVEDGRAPLDPNEPIKRKPPPKPTLETNQRYPTKPCPVHHKTPAPWAM